MDQAFVIGRIKTPIGDVPRVSSDLTTADRWGAVKARWGVWRMRFTVDPGLYVLGNPDAKSPVLAILSALLTGAVLTPLLLPWVPGRAFSLKGWILGLASAWGLILLNGSKPNRDTAEGGCTTLRNSEFDV